MLEHISAYFWKNFLVSINCFWLFNSNIIQERLTFVRNIFLQNLCYYSNKLSNRIGSFLRQCNHPKKANKNLKYSQISRFDIQFYLIISREKIYQRCNSTPSKFFKEFIDCRWHINIPNSNFVDI